MMSKCRRALRGSGSRTLVIAGGVSANRRLRQRMRQMIEAQNELRRRRGAEEITEADVHRQAQQDQALRARGRGPFAEGGGIEDDAPEHPPPRARRKAAKRRSRASMGWISQ